MALRTLVRWGGLAAMVAGMLWFVVRALVLWSPPPLTYDDYNRLFSVPLLLFFGGLVGLHAQQSARGPLARLGKLLAFLGCTLLLTGNIVEFWLVLLQAKPNVAAADERGELDVWIGSEIGWITFLVGLFLLCIGLVLWGIAAVRTKSFLRSRFIPLLIGTHGLLAFVMAPLILPAADVLLVLFGLGWIWLGYALWSHSSSMPTGAGATAE